MSQQILSEESKKNSEKSRPTSKRRRWLRWIYGFSGLLLVIFLILGSIAVVKMDPLRNSLHRYFFVYPRYAKSLESLKASLRPPPQDGWKDFRAVIHAHSYLSHDSEGTPREIVAAAKKVGIDAIFMTDHASEDNRQLTEALVGDINGVLFFPGYESSANLGVFPAKVTGELRAVVQHRPLKRLFDNITERGGLVIYPHPEAAHRRWSLTNFQGMEIYNIHTDAKELFKSKSLLLEGLINTALSAQKYPLFGLKIFFDEPTLFLGQWDRLNEQRRVFGTAGNDAHQNTSVALKMTTTGEVGLYMPANAEEPTMSWGGLLAKFAGLLTDEEQTLWFLQLDPYELSYSYVNTYLLSEEHSQEAVFEALKAGRGYVAFGGYLDPRGFRFEYRLSEKTLPMGSETVFEQGGKLVARLPLPTEARIIKDGQLLAKFADVSDFAIDVVASGIYRVEVRIDVADESWPWIYSNPIRIQGK